MFRNVPRGREMLGRDEVTNVREAGGSHNSQLAPRGQLARAGRLVAIAPTYRHNEPYRANNL